MAVRPRHESSNEHDEPSWERGVAELARVLHDSETAAMVARRAGFPASRLPHFRTPLVFWSVVAEEARNGALEGGLRSIFEAAALLYPANEVFRRLGRTASPTRGPTPPPQSELAAIAEQFFSQAGRTTQPGNAGLRVPEPVRIHPSHIGPEDLRALGLAIPNGELGYLVHAQPLSEDDEATLDTLRLRGTSIVPISEPQMRAALQDGNARTVLHALTLRGRGGDNLFLTRNALIERRFLFGRTELLARLGSALSRGEQILLTGSRKIGKTSLLNVLRQDLSEQPVVFADLQRYDRHDPRWVPHLFGEIVSGYDRWGSARFGDWPGQSETVLDGVALEAALLRRRTWHIEREPPTQLIVILDELERLLPRPGERDVAASFIRATGALRALAQGSDRFLSLIAADLRTTANRRNELEGAGTNPLFRFFQEVPLPALAPNALLEMLARLGRMMGISSVRHPFGLEVLELSGGHPYLARTMAGAAAACRHDPSTLDLRDLAAGLEELEEDDELGDFFRQNFWQPLSAAEREYLLHVAHGEPPPDDRVSRASLKHQGLVTKNVIGIGAFRRWILETVVLEQDQLEAG